ncbi:hypothetical protein BJP25_05200 [Actinokineospora bangkokensis]|uniref:Serine hydrolase n=1 Tax=Actinokineospora bangkokensis TaxID=1193682 RepID=A0A1Q9LBT2_9PSEU|nr:hypothetical protein BJP25_05200 [Actinokineospora bangkokensis]
MATAAVLALSTTLVGSAAEACERPRAQAPLTRVPDDVGTTTAAAPAPQARSLSAEPVVAAVRAVQPSATVGVLVWDSRTGETVLSANADLRFRSASVVKLLIAIAAAGDPAHAERVTGMLTTSDDDDASALWTLLGGDTLPSATAAALGITGVSDPDIPGRWGNTLISPAAVAQVYRHLLVGLPGALAEMARATATAADGFDQSFGIPSAFGTWAVKQGWGNGSGFTAVHSTGLVDDRYVVVLMTESPTAATFSTNAAAVTAGARALAALLGATAPVRPAAPAP